MGGFESAAMALGSMVANQQQSRQAAKAQSAQMEAQNALVVQQQQIKAKQQRDLLSRQMASARARLAAGGVGVGSGSGQALLAGMVKDSESQLADSDALLQGRQAASSAGNSSSGSGLLQGLNTVQQAWNVIQRLPGGG
ncbi:hypothetical protein [Magnetospirillum aberrantis]|uniref:Uncharacterized protein n=1 Tax=Magnetospirillum aberrantis SpK TaxID=908842 RepID=A0A7C9V167_9PROT|nr:hypothetical protein [Magnetospirillum aberrantis]NFV81895.1 hypothetical protein [Magnetospirillum aberrantis SpK]